MNGLQIKLQLDDNQPARWFDVETINFDDEVCFADGAGEHIEIEYQGEPLRIKPPSLTDDQQEVLEWLQIYADKDSGDKPFQTIFFLWDCIKSNNLGNDELTALRKLTRAEQFQVLAAFAEWGLSTLDN